ncbi:hypothetical protein L914_04512 [Phytophthora nicotianae]|uniref:Uncharacterized protein n=1 Tax=Phytophthora nicotianae TaxID=4792 RepID=W2NSV4_PHYNI|nr:hypothetical protein L914_04512 [Phytophthora nicotianae]
MSAKNPDVQPPLQSYQAFVSGKPPYISENQLQRSFRRDAASVGGIRGRMHASIVLKDLYQ